jgi:transcriptional regulator with XRE-family HTH domain
MTLADYLKKAGMKHGEFASRIGVSQAAVTRYATGKRVPRRSIMRKIAEETRGKVTADDFMVEAA